MDYGKKLLPLLLLPLLFSPLIAGAFGVSPPAIAAENLLKGSRYEATIFLVRGNVSEAIAVQAVIKVPDKIKNWVTLDKGNNFVIPAGVNQYPVKVTIEVPQDADLGIYGGQIAFNTLPTGSAARDKQVVISVGAAVSLGITVGEGVFSDFNIDQLDILDIKEGQKPKVMVTLQNTGNVPVAPERATFDLFDKNGQVRLGYGQVEKFPETPGFQTKKFVVEFPIDIKLGLGEYWAEARIYKGGVVVSELKTVFNVVEKKFNWLLWSLILFGIAVVGFSLKFFIRRRRRRSMPTENVAPAHSFEPEKVPPKAKKRSVKKKK